MFFLSKKLLYIPLIIGICIQAHSQEHTNSYRPSFLASKTLNSHFSTGFYLEHRGTIPGFKNQMNIFEPRLNWKLRNNQLELIYRFADELKIKKPSQTRLTLGWTHLFPVNKSFAFNYRFRYQHLFLHAEDAIYLRNKVGVGFKILKNLQVLPAMEIWYSLNQFKKLDLLRYALQFQHHVFKKDNLILNLAYQKRIYGEIPHDDFIVGTTYAHSFK